jgi:hypothetical protein
MSRTSPSLHGPLGRETGKIDIAMAVLKLKMAGKTVKVYQIRSEPSTILYSIFNGLHNFTAFYSTLQHLTAFDSKYQVTGFGLRVVRFVLQVHDGLIFRV